ncbi:MAG: hypothetical protein KF850_17755 [Labilithrix sp.]|nr:hypothetical protein [Labilithrix sp.]
MSFFGRALVFMVVAAGALACSTFQPVDTLRPRAAHDLQCPDEKLTFTPLSGDCEGTKVGHTYDCTYGVRCGEQQATYVHVKGSNTWVMDAAATPKASN